MEEGIEEKGRAESRKVGREGKEEEKGREQRKGRRKRRREEGSCMLMNVTNNLLPW